MLKHIIVLVFCDDVDGVVDGDGALFSHDDANGDVHEASDADNDEDDEDDDDESKDNQI